jgi:predicted DNA-binding transcriptional regulator YafY
LPERLGIAELQHNRCLRLDRIEAILETAGSWRGRLDTIDVEMRLLDGLASAYEAKSEDTADDRGVPVRTVTRRVVNLFWFIREVRRYGSDCVVIGPEAVREQIADDLAKSLSRYR